MYKRQDFDIADKLYFEPLTPEDVESIVDIEKPDGAVVQFGGQTAIKLTEALMKMGVPILGTAAEDVDAAEDRERFDAVSYTHLDVYKRQVHDGAPTDRTAKDYYVPYRDYIKNVASSEIYSTWPRATDVYKRQALHQGERCV